MCYYTRENFCEKEIQAPTKKRKGFKVHVREANGKIQVRCFLTEFKSGNILGSGGRGKERGW